MSFTEFHGITMAENAFVENFVVENLSADPTPTEAGRVWFNTTEKQYKATTLNASGGVIVQVLGGKEQLDQFILDLSSTTAGKGSALVGYSGETGTNSLFSVSAGTVEASIDSVVQGIDSNKKALADLGTGTLTNLQNEIDATQAGVGLEADGTFTGVAGSSYLTASGTVKAALSTLDAEVKQNEVAIATEAATRAAQDALKVDKAGDSMTGELSMTGNKITNVGTPVDDQDATNKVYVDNAINGISWKQPVKAATTANITLSATQTIDGVVLVAGDRVLVKNQTDATENGVYIVSESAWTRSADVDDSPDAEVEEGLAVFVEQGTVNGNNGFTLLGTDTNGTAGIQVGSDPLDFVQFSGAGQVIAGAGISRSGNELYINMGAGIVELPSDEVGIDVLPTGSLFTTVDGITSSTATGAQLAVKLNGTTLTSNAAGLKISDAILDGIDTDIQTVQNELDVTQLGAGLGTGGTYTANTNANYIASAASLKQADNMLDAQVKINTSGLSAEVTARSNADANIQAELDVTQTGAGLGTDGAYTANSSANYIKGAVSLKDADNKLDTRLKTAVDTIAQEISDRTAAVSSLKTAINANSFTFESSTPATSHVVTHNLGNAFVTVAMWVKQTGGTFKNDIAQITLTDNNSLTVDLTVARDIRVVVTSPTDV